MAIIFPTPPLAKWYVRLFHWLKPLYKKEPVGFLALIMTIILALTPLIREAYYSLVGPSYSAIVDLKSPIYPLAPHSIIVTIENYSGIPVQCLQASFTVSPDTFKVKIEPTSIVVGTIPRYSLSNKMEIILFSQMTGKGQLHIRFQPINENSDVIPKTQDVPFTITDRE